MTIRHIAVSLFVCLAALLLFPAPASAQTSEWTVCASEGEVCAFSGTQQVRYGANGSYVYRSLSDGISVRTACSAILRPVRSSSAPLVVRPPTGALCVGRWGLRI